MPRRAPRSSEEIRLDILSRVNTPLGFFTLGLLVVEGILAVLVTRVEGSNQTLLLYGILASLILLIVSVLVLALKPTPVPPPPPPPPPPPDDVGKLMAEVMANTGKAIALGFGTLKSEILRELSDLAINARQWNNGELHTSSDRYNAVLLRLYDEAQTSIFSTTVRDYLDDWTPDLMEQMIQASSRSPATRVKRVFVFGARSEINDRVISVLKRFRQERKIETRVYLENEDYTDPFPADISRDFVVIDEGSTIGVTVSYGKDRMQAIWYFGDKDRSLKFRELCSNLHKSSKSVDDILEWWGKQEKPAERPVSATLKPQVT